MTRLLAVEHCQRPAGVCGHPHFLNLGLEVKLHIAFPGLLPQQQADGLLLLRSPLFLAAHEKLNMLRSLSVPAL